MIHFESNWQFALEEIPPKVLVVTSEALQEVEFGLKYWKQIAHDAL
jgi:hypothetical protein